MYVKTAVIQILRQEGAALHVKDISKKIIDAGLWKSDGNTPEATVSARIYVDIKENGDQSPFIKVGPQTFALRDSAKIPNSAEPVVTTPAEQTPEEPPENEGLSFTACARKVLEESGAKKPMHYKEITEKALLKGWLTTTGKTPEATMNAQVITDIERKEKRGEPQLFVMHGRGYVGLKQWENTGLESQIDQHNQHVRENLLKRLLDMKPGEFEKLIAYLLGKMGFENVQVTKPTRDGGIDVRGTQVTANGFRIKMAVQVKRWNLKNNIQAPVIQQVRGSLGVHERGQIITTSDFSKGARDEATRLDCAPIDLVNGEQLVMLLIEHGVVVKRSEHTLFTLTDNDESGLKIFDDAGNGD